MEARAIACRRRTVQERDGGSAGRDRVTAAAVPIGELCALAAAASWAVGSLLFARIGRRVAPGAMNLGKCVAASIVLSLARVALAPWLGGVVGRADGALLLAVSGLVGLTIGDTAHFGALVAIGVQRAILLLASAPVFAAIGGALFLGERVAGREALGIGLTLAGIALVVTGRPHRTRNEGGSTHEAAERAPGAAGGSGEARWRRGVALGVVAALGQAGGSLLSRKAMLLGTDPLAAAAGRLIVGAVGLVVVARVTGHLRPWAGDLGRDRSWAKVAGASLIGTVGGIWLAQLGLAYTSSTGVASTLLATSPIFALPLAHFAGHERITARGVAGTLLAIGGVVLLSLPAA